MIITRQKPLEEILEFLKGCSKVFLVGCNLCATSSKTGGETELKSVGEELKKNGKTVTGYAVLDPACSILEVKRFWRKYQKEVDEADAILSFACGGGTQAVSDVLGPHVVYPGNDTLFQGDIAASTLKERRFEEKCSLCGDCMLALTGVICPHTRCPKGLLNGPCGGVKDGKCEIDKDLECAWIAIFKKLKENGNLDKMRQVRGPRDYSKKRKPEKRIIT